MKRYYAMMADIAGKRCIVVGGGKVAERKTAALLDARGSVCVISPTVTSQLRFWHEQGVLEWRQRLYRAGDASKASLVFAASDDPDVNRQVAQEAEQHGIWANVANEPGEGSFVVPTGFRRGPLHIAVTASGASPHLAVEVRRKLEVTISEEYEVLALFLERMRNMLKSRVNDEQARKEFMRRLVVEQVSEWLAEGTVAERTEEWIKRMEEHPCAPLW
ncbi:precorrin-2 dehydrogenase [Xylanibacillus composti]|uniref:precorrin-2 dehydrogenase n=1 Tax=Xylanibacillus composti TaxID=1572762 RepID=A0A8J4H3I5_9BACL|nr:bifunctional precorrin-2 dehydrogenase/sirohydrochlorin ferrochelatase [Xylanibacillus composti]GIQ70199.1 precorrin-2 dehydrogenase [Xylanibacillus composti]